MNIFYYEVAIPLPIRDTFTYESKERISSGSRVLVKFRNKEIVGYVIGNISKKPSFSTIEISSVLDKEPIYNSKDLSILFWLADYYLHPFGEVLDTFCPSLLRKAINREMCKTKLSSEYKAIEEDKKFN